MSTPINSDYYKLAGYAAGAQLNHNPFDLQELNSQLIFAGGTVALPLAWKTGKAVLWQAPKWAWQNYGNYTSAWQTLKAQNQAAKDAIKYLNGSNVLETINNRSNYNSLLEAGKRIPVKPGYSSMAAATNPTARAKLFNQSLKASYYDTARKLIEEAKTKKLTGQALKDQLKKVDEAIAKADLEVHKAIQSGIIKPVTIRGKAWAGIKKYSGYDAVNGALKKGAVSSNKAVRTLAKGAKGGGLATAAIALAVETPEIIETYQKLGASKGTKQLAKTGAVVAAEGAGFAIGAKVGAIAGAKAGAVIGTFIGGPVGTAVGGAVGALIGVGVGILGSWLAGKGARALVGKSELEKHREAEAEKLVQNAKKSEKGKQELLAKVEKKAEEENGCTDEEVIEAYEKLAADREAQIAYTQEYTTRETTQSYSSQYADVINQLSSIAGGSTSQFQGNMPITPFKLSMPNMFNIYNPYEMIA